MKTLIICIFILGLSLSGCSKEEEKKESPMDSMFQGYKPKNKDLSR